MGVPKFFRWLSERYPCLSEELKEYQIPEFDNLYLDMNGIIHVCSHPNDFDPHFRISEEQIFTDIFHYIEVLFRLIRPKKLFFMAVDGVAPRAKMNQQRGRRFSSAKEAESLEKKALEKGESLPKEKRFDSNCITPGTRFMAKLQEQLKYFVANKISTDKLWQRPTVILSGHSVPGEGEHKIMDYIRYVRSKPGWDPMTRHCLYGLDADLLILGLCTHEPNFTLLREEVKFVKSSKNKRTSTAETTNYTLLHLSILRGYLDLEFNSLKSKLAFPYDLENIIDDWVLMGFLVGNDFVPHLPHLHIANNALGILYDTYRAVLPTLDGYINEGGVLNLERFEKFLVELSQFDMDQFTNVYADMKYFESKTGRKLVQSEDGGRKQKIDEEALQALIKSTEFEMFDFNNEECALDEALEPNGLETVNNEEESDKLFFKEFKMHKRDYYINKMEYPAVTRDVLKKEAEGYVTALQWILYYYYKGCPSWGWYYPHHYSPYVSDLKGFSSLSITFNIGTPFLPFQQLLAVLPAASKEFLPEGYQKLMTSQDSAIIDYYPKDFKFDLNGKKQEWEAVVLIPFIEEKRLLDAMEPYTGELTMEEKVRNSHGSMQIYTYSSQSLGSYSAPEYFPVIGSNHAKQTDMFPSSLAVPPERLVTGAHPSLAGKSTIYMPGFPILSTLDITGVLEKRSVKVFEYPSKNENMILTIVEREEMRRPVEEIADDIITARDHIYVAYPHLTRARVKSLQTQKVCVTRQGESRYDIQKNSMPSVWQRKLSSIQQHHITRLGIVLAGCDSLVYAYPLEGTKLSFKSSGKAVREMLWSQELVCYPLDTCLLDVNTGQNDQKESCQVLSLSDVFPPGQQAYMIGPIDYGYTAKVKETLKDCLLIDLVKTTEPDFTSVKKAINSSVTGYYPSYYCAERLGISSQLFSRITSGILVQSPHTDSDKANIGLALKYSKSNQQMVGFSRKEGNHWVYSSRAIDLVNQYMDKFPDLFEFLAINISDDIFFKDKMFPNDKSMTRLAEIRTWLKSLDKGELRSVGGELLDPLVIRKLEETITSYSQKDLILKTIKLKPHYLYLPKAELMVAAPDPEADHQMLDRIVYVRECHSIPLGAKGTIIGIEKKAKAGCGSGGDWWREGGGGGGGGGEGSSVWDEAATLYDIVFDLEVVGGQALYGSTRRSVYRLTKQVFINLTYGQRKYPEQPGLTTPVQTQIHRNTNSSRQSNYSNAVKGNSGGGKRPNLATNSINSLMPSFSSDTSVAPPSSTATAGSGGTGRTPSQIPGNSTPLPLSAPPPPVNGQPSTPGNPSGSVTNFFNAYRSNNNEDTRLGHSQQVQQKVAGGGGGGSRRQANQQDPLADMWNLLKNLQVRNTESPEQQDPETLLSTQQQGVMTSADVILSQTFTRSSSSHNTQQQEQITTPSSNASNRTTTGAIPSSVNNNLLPALNQNNNLISTSLPLFNNPSASASNQFIEQTEALKKLLCIRQAQQEEEQSVGGDKQGLQTSLDTPQQQGGDISGFAPLMGRLASQQTMSSSGQRSTDQTGCTSDRYSRTSTTPQQQQHVAGSRSCCHLPSCMTYFLNLCSKYMLDEPSHWLCTSADGVVAICRLSDGYQFFGPTRPTAPLAVEGMFCKGITLLHDRFGPPQEAVVHMNRRHVGNSGFFPPPPPSHLINKSFWNTQQQQQPQQQQQQPSPQPLMSCDVTTTVTHQSGTFVPAQAQVVSGGSVVSRHATSSDTPPSAGRVTASSATNHQQHNPPPPNQQQHNRGGESKRRSRPRNMRIAAKFHNPPSETPRH